MAVHIYTQTIHRTTQITNEQQITTNVEECGPCSVFASFTLAFALQLRKKHGKTCQGKKNLSLSTFDVTNVHVASNATTSEVCASLVLLLMLLRNQKWGAAVCWISMTTAKDFVMIDRLSKTLNGQRLSRSYVDTKSHFLRL